MAKRKRRTAIAPSPQRRFRKGDLVQLSQTQDCHREHGTVIDLYDDVATVRLFECLKPDDGIRDGVPLDQLKLIPKLTPRKYAALVSLKQMTRSSFSAYNLLGGRMAGVRAMINYDLKELEGPPPEVSANDLHKALLELTGVDGQSKASDVALIKAWCVAVMNHDMSNL